MTATNLWTGCKKQKSRLAAGGIQLVGKLPPLSSQQESSACWAVVADSIAIDWTIPVWHHTQQHLLL